MVVSVIVATILASLYFCFLLLKWMTTDQTTPSQARNTAIPGPYPSHPRLGNFPDIVKAGSLHHYLKRMHELYGHVVQIWYGTRPVVSTASPEAFKVQAKIYTRPGMDFISPLFGRQGIQFANGEDAKHRMNTFNYFLRKDAIEEYCPIFEKVVQTLISQWNLVPHHTPVPVKENMYYLSSKVIGMAVCGEFFENDDNVKRLSSWYTKAWPTLEINFAEGLPAQGSKEREDFDNAVSEIHDIVRDAVASRSSSSDLKLIDVITEMHQDEVTRHGDILAYILGGFHNTSITMTWCLYYAAKNQEMQQKIYDEITDIAQGKNVTAEITDKLRYLRQFINETLRLRFIASVAIRETEKEMEVDGHKLSPGTFLVQALSVVLTDDKIWPDPGRFDPERFSPENSKTRPPLAFSPFGFAGKRLCPGREFFYRESMVQLACLFRKYKFELVDDKEVHVTYGLLTRPTDEMYLYISHRN